MYICIVSIIHISIHYNYFNTMKKIILSSIFMLSVFVGHAQHATGSLTIQPKVGINLANYSGGEGGSNIRLGGVAGAELEYQISDIVSLSGGLLYSMQGAKGSAMTDIGNVDATIKVDYLNVPIMGNVYVAKGFAVKLGIQPGFKLSSKVTAKNNGVSATVDMPGMKTVDISIPVGLSYEFSNFVIDARYNWGVSKVVDEANDKNSVLQFTFGYKFAL